MVLVPLIHLKDGRPVRGRPGAWEPMPTPYPDGGGDVKGLVRHLYTRFGDVCVVDLGTGATGDADHTLHQKIAKQQVALWIDASPQTLEDVMDLFVSGAHRVTVRVDQLDADELLDILDLADGEIVLGYAYEDERALERLLKKHHPAPFVGAGAAGIALIDLGAAGTKRGFDTSVLRHVEAFEIPVYTAGGVRDPTDAEQVLKAGADGVLVGEALWDDLDAFAALAQRRRPEREAPEEDDDAVGPSASSSMTSDPMGSFGGIVPSRPQINPTDDERR